MLCSLREIAVQFFTEGNSYFVVMGHDNVEVAYSSRETPELFGQTLTWEMKEIFDAEEPSFDVIRIGDNVFVLSAFMHDLSGKFMINLTEMRTDGIGMPLENPVPRTKAISGLPMITARKDYDAIALNVHQFPEKLSSLGQIVLDNFVESLNIQP
jgi:hypothetical protein